MNDVGDKIKEFRKRKNKTQLQLEIDINASSGVISRIENSETNPTKETLEKISEALNLTVKEKNHLYGFRDLYPTDKEIELAIEEVSDFFAKPTTLAYLIDDWFRLIKISDSLFTMLGLSKDQKELALGKNLLELLLDPAIGVRSKLDPDYFIDNYALEFARCRYELNQEYYGNYLEEILDTVKHFPDFDEIWERSAKLTKEIFSPGSRISYLIINAQKTKISHAREQLKSNPRFEVVELFNPIPYE